MYKDKRHTYTTNIERAKRTACIVDNNYNTVPFSRMKITPIPFHHTRKHGGLL